MSVEKTISYEEIPYTQIYTNVIQNINNLEAGFVWVYLLSKPKDWDVIKEHLKNKFNIGDDKIKKIFSYLNSHRLIEYITHRDTFGKIIKHETRVLNGSKFLTDEQVKELSTEKKATGSKSHPVANHTCGSGALQIKENTNKRKSREPARKKQLASQTLSQNFEPDEKRKAKLSETATRSGLAKDDLLTKFKNIYQLNQKRSTDWQLEFENFLINEKSKPEPSQYKPVSQEARCTVPDYGPGHPTWDAMNDWENKNRSKQLAS